MCWNNTMVVFYVVNLVPSASMASNLGGRKQNSWMTVYVHLVQDAEHKVCKVPSAILICDIHFIWSHHYGRSVAKLAKCSISIWLHLKYMKRIKARCPRAIGTRIRRENPQGERRKLNDLYNWNYQEAKPSKLDWSKCMQSLHNFGKLDINHAFLTQFLFWADYYLNWRIYFVSPFCCHFIHIVTCFQSWNLLLLVSLLQNTIHLTSFDLIPISILTISEFIHNANPKHAALTLLNVLISCHSLFS